MPSAAQLAGSIQGRTLAFGMITQIRQVSSSLERCLTKLLQWTYEQEDTLPDISHAYS